MLKLINVRFVKTSSKLVGVNFHQNRCQKEKEQAENLDGTILKDDILF